MISELTVENLAIIEKTQIRLGSGLTVLTGETGAGKSLLIDAIELALGERADTELVRTGAPAATVDVVFDLSRSTSLATRLGEQGATLEGNLLFVHREVPAEGRSQSRIGGKLTPVALLKQIGRQVVDLHGQHDHQSLMDPESHLSFIDQWIGEPAQGLVARLSELHSKVLEAKHQLNTLKSNLRDREQKLDILRFQVNEIEAVSPVVGELEQLEALLGRLKNSEKLATATFAAIEALNEQESSASETLGVAIRALSDVARHDAEIEAMLEPLREALAQTEEASHQLRTYGEKLDADPERLDELANRIDAYRRLMRKYGDTTEALLSFWADAADQLARLQDAVEGEAFLESAVREAELMRSVVADELSALRKGKAVEFAELVQTQLHDLAMNRAQFAVNFQPKEADSTGVDDVQFFFSANVGEDPKPLSKIASGGEISRVMLAIKTAMAGKAGVPTLIFDEVDAGLGGRAAVTVGRKLQELARHYQVIVISHLPQIAARADHHFRIEKTESAGRVATHVRELTAAERVEEIARMLAGDVLTEAALANARDMLSNNLFSGS